MANTKITSRVIADDAVTTAAIADDAITSAKIDSTSTGITLADLTVDTSTLKVDATNNRVGIGTTSPAVKLEVSDTSTNAFIKIVADNDDFSGLYFADQQGLAGEISYDHNTNQFKIWSGADTTGSPHLLIKNTYIDNGKRHRRWPWNNIWYSETVYKGDN